MSQLNVQFESEEKPERKQSTATRTDHTVRTDC